ncbi:MAG: MBL fold metallo-hydrolase [Gemmatimonadetes bacterium]|nr:MBL fold metallo-hydrolase [Gemmatimonadota bacterium]
MEQIADKTHLIDLRHCGQASVIGAAILELDSGVAIIDPGPASTIPVLRLRLHEAGIGLLDIRAVLVTHIHLDHSGACGTLIRANPKINVFVHQRGAPHLVDPSRLVASAARLFGDRMAQLWGTVLAVPEENLRIVQDGDRFREGGRSLDIAYTPGHASHHVSYFDSSSGIAFVGDAAGGRIRDGKVVLPATPPPDIDTGVMLESVNRILEWRPDRLFVTHFGPATHVKHHAALLEERLIAWSARVRESLLEEGDDAARAARFAEWVLAHLREVLSEEQVAAYELGAPPDLSWYGLARYWRKKGSPGASGTAPRSKRKSL